MNSFIKKLIGFSFGPIAGACISFITVPLTTYFISPSEYGKASMFFLFQMIIGTLFYLGIDQAYTREYHAIKNKLNLLQNAILIPLLLALILLLLTIIIPKQISNILFESPNYFIPTILFGVMTVFMVIERFILLSIRMEEKALEYSLLNIFVKLAIFLFTILFILFIRKDFLAIVYSIVFGQIIGDVYLVIRYRRIFEIKNFFVDKKLIKRMVLFGLPIVVATSLSSLLNSVDRLALRTWSDFYQLGIFTATLKIATVLTIIQSSFTSFWVPTAYRWYQEGKKIHYFKLVSDSILLLMSIVFIVILVFKNLIVSILSSGYYDSKFIIGFLCLPPIIYTVSETTCLGIVFSRKSYLSIWVGLIAIIPNIIICVLLVPKFGATGASIATSIGYYFFFIARTYFSNKSGTAFPIIKHHCIFSLLLIIGFINLFEVSKLIILNLLSLLIILSIQFSTIKQIWYIYKKKSPLELEHS